MTLVYHTLGEVAFTAAVPLTLTIFGHQILAAMVVKEIAADTFQFNDLLVTKNSARLAPFREVAQRKDNHATIANPVVGQAALDAIRTVQPLRVP